MRAVIDTNVLISAMLRDRDPEQVILFVAEHEDWQWVATPEVLAEYREVMSRARFGFPPELQERWLRVVDNAVVPFESVPTVESPRDPKDTAFVACALAAGADYLVTGDRDLLEFKLPRTAIVTVAEFKRLVISRESS